MFSSTISSWLTRHCTLLTLINNSSLKTIAFRLYSVASNSIKRQMTLDNFCEPFSIQNTIRLIFSTFNYLFFIKVFSVGLKNDKIANKMSSTQCDKLIAFHRTFHCCFIQKDENHFYPTQLLLSLFFEQTWHWKEKQFYCDRREQLLRNVKAWADECFSCSQIFSRNFPLQTFSTFLHRLERLLTAHHSRGACFFARPLRVIDPIKEEYELQDNGRATTNRPTWRFALNWLAVWLN